MNRYIATNPKRCTACGDCLEACAKAHAEVGRVGIARLSLVDGGEGNLCAALSCHHCEGAPCMSVCPTDSITRSEDGLVAVDEHRCVGCKLCALACPFGAIHISGTPLSGVAGIEFGLEKTSKTDPMLDYTPGVIQAALKCDLCSYSDGEPHCVKACKTNALRLVDASDTNGVAFNKRVKSGRTDKASTQDKGGAK